METKRLGSLFIAIKRSEIGHSVSCAKNLNSFCYEKLDCIDIAYHISKSAYFT